MNNFPALQELPNVVSVEDKSNKYMNRVRVTFKDGGALSIIQDPNQVAPSGDLYFEIATYNAEGEFNTDEIFGNGDVVMPYLTLEELHTQLEKLK